MQYLKDVSIYFPENTVEGSEKVTVLVTGQMIHLYLKIKPYYESEVNGNK